MASTDDLKRVFEAIKNGDLDVDLSDASVDPAVRRAFQEMVVSIREERLRVEEDLQAAEHSMAEMRTSYEEITALQLLSASLSTTFELDEVLNLFVNLAGEIVGYDACAFYLPDRDSYRIYLERSPSPALTQAPRQEISTSLLHWCVRENKVVPVPYEEFTGQRGPEARSFILIPILSHQRAIAVLVLECAVPSSQITQQQVIMLALLSAQTAAACENAELYRGMKQKNIELAKLKNYLTNILENVTTGIIALDTEGHITTFNRAAEKLFGMKNVEGSLFFQVFQDPIRSTIRQLLVNSMLEAEVSNYELDVEVGAKNMSLVFSTSLLRDEEEKPIGYVVACRDISETKELDAMRKLSQLKSEFLSNVSHELRTPLTSIKAYSETLLNRLDRLPRTTLIESLRIVDGEADRLARLLDDLLDFSRMESGRLKLKFEGVDLKQMLDGVVSQMRMQSDRHEIRLELPDGDTPAMLDVDRMKQALINILSNAIKYSPDGGVVKVKCLAGDGVYRIQVTDHGMGIAPENLSHIFEKFYRVEGDHMYKISGTGIGLSITKTIIEAHGGTIGVESQLGQGTTVFFELPRAS